MLWPCHHWSISLVTMMTGTRYPGAPRRPFPRPARSQGECAGRAAAAWTSDRGIGGIGGIGGIPGETGQSQGGRNTGETMEKNLVKHPEQNGETTWRKIGKEFLKARLARSSRWTSGHLSGLLKVVWFLVSWCLPKMSKMIWNYNLSVSSYFHVYFYFGLFSYEMFCPFDLQRSLQLTTAV